MLYLAQVQIAQVQSQGTPSQIELTLLAGQKSEYAWVVLPNPITTTIDASQAADFGNGRLVLAETDGEDQVLRIVDAKDWMLDMMQQFLISGITPEFLRQETERAEQWRQSLTLQSQELDRRALELEARREQIQELEENLNRQQKNLAVENQGVDRDREG